MRQVNGFHSDWKFHRDEVPGWRTVTLPHDWGIEGPFDRKWASGTGYLPGGIGWYRKRFAAPEASQGQKIFLHFDGVYCNSDVWINGHYLGRRPNGFIGFRYNLTPYLRLGEKNTVVVRVDHSQYADARWYTGSGINRNVFLIVTDPIHIKTWGVFVTTPIVTAEQAEVQVETTIQNQTKADVEVEHDLVDAQGTVAAQAQIAVSITSGGEQVVASRLTVPEPRLWSVEQPNLYTLRTRIARDGQTLDNQETPVGIRAFRFDPDQGFFLNEKNLKLKGVCLHDDAGALGTAVPPKVWERRLQTLKAAGTNAIRMAHNPHMPELYDLCDRLGLLVQDEAFDEWEGGKNKWIAGWNVGQPGKDGYHSAFQDWAEADLRDMILRDRNHPSVIMWSIGNEIDYPNDPYTHEIISAGANPQSYGIHFKPENPHSDRLGVVARRLVATAKQHDTTRPITAALAAAPISNVTGFADALDVVGYNYQESRYAEDHAAYPGRVLYGSENGMRWSFWQAVLDNPYISGQFLWTGIDYLGEARGWPTRSSGAGLLDLAGLPKPEYFFRQSIWTTEPMVYLGTREVPAGDEGASLWSHQMAEPVWRGTDGGAVRVNCFTNCDGAELFVNGRSAGVHHLADAEEHVLWWDVEYEPGTLTVHGLCDGAVVATGELKTSGPAAKIRAEADTSILATDGVDMAHIIVTVTDANGVPVYDSNAEITWAIEGPARLRGLESGDHASHEDYQAPTRRAFHGRLLGYVQSTEAAGPVTIRLTSPGLEEAVVTLRTAG